MMTGERFSLVSMGTVRTLCIFLVALTTGILFVWMLTEQEKVRACIEPKIVQTPPAPPPVRNVTKPSWDYNWDMKTYKNVKDTQAAGVRTLLLIRHGQYTFPTGRLTDKGRQQANLTGLRLKTLNMPYKLIIHSTLIRAVETARIIHSHLPHLPIFSDESIIEGGPIPPQPTVNYWSLPDRTYFVDGPRIEGAFRKYFHRADATQGGQTFEILVGHANIFRYFALRALQFPREAWMRVFIAHGSITLLHINPDGTVSMSRFGDSGHFPPRLVTY